MSLLPSPNAPCVPLRPALRLFASILLAVTPASANGTFDFPPSCPEQEIRAHHIDRHLELVSVTRDGQSLDVSRAPKLRWNGATQSAEDLNLRAPTIAVFPMLVLDDVNGEVAQFRIVTDTAEASP